VTASQNGWRVIGRDECTDVEIPGGEVPTHPEFAWLFQDLAIRWHDTVEPLVWPGCWGWANRPIKGSTVTSNHASGTAVDFCAPKHPQGVAIGRHFTAAQLDAVAALEARYFGVLRWGGRWTGKSVDGMHWEGQPGVTVEAVRAMTDMLRGGTTPGPIPVPDAPPAPTGWTGPDAQGSGTGFRADAGQQRAPHTGPAAFLRSRYPLYAKGLDADGWYGPQTAAVIAEYARRSAIRGADGLNVGPQLARSLYVAGFRG
jgi:hypothetical protein